MSHSSDALRKPIHLHQDGPAVNRGTLCVLESREQRSFKELFMLHHGMLRSFHAQCTLPGLMMAVISPRGQIALAYTGSSDTGVRAAIFGRHTRCDLQPVDDPSASLRHLAIMLQPRVHGEDLRFKLIDLNTPGGFSDEHDRQMSSLEVEGPVFVRCGGSALFLLPTGDELPWPEDPEQAWACLPERVYLDERTAGNAGMVRARLVRQLKTNGPHDGRRPCTIVSVVKGLVSADRKLLLAESEEAREVIRISTPKRSSSIIVRLQAGVASPRRAGRRSRMVAIRDIVPGWELGAPDHSTTMTQQIFSPSFLNPPRGP